MNAIQAIDRLGEIRAQMANLKALEDAALSEVKALGVGAHEADMFRAAVSEVAPTESPDPKAMEAKLMEMGVDGRWFSKNMKVRAGYTTVRISARKGV